MSDVIETTEQVTYPKPKKTYVRNGRCTYCGSKKIKTLYGYDWCDKPCSIGKLGLKNYESFRSCIKICDNLTVILLVDLFEYY